MKILIADDAATMRALLLSGLTRLGHEVEVVADGDDAWKVLERPEAPEIAILDWMMPGMKGTDICRKLRERKDGRYVYVVLLTGLDNSTDLQAGIEAGADDYMTKPFKPAELDARLKAARRILVLQSELQAARAEILGMAYRDALTKLPSRRAIRAHLNDTVTRAAREKTFLGVILLNIDGLGQINNRHGDSEGDAVLQQVAARLSETIRPGDNAGRFGGGEFLVVAPGCNMYEASMYAERLRKALCDKPVASPRGPIGVSASVGVSAGQAEPNQKAQTLIAAAYQALARAKAAGGNKVLLAATESQAALLSESQAIAGS